MPDGLPPEVKRAMVTLRTYLDNNNSYTLPPDDTSLGGRDVGMLEYMRTMGHDNLQVISSAVKNLRNEMR